MEFIDYLRQRHDLRPRTKRLSEVSAEQYENRFHNLQRHGIYTTEREVTESNFNQIELQYKNGSQHYLIPLRYYVEYLNYPEEQAISKALHPDTAVK